MKTSIDKQGYRGRGKSDKVEPIQRTNQSRESDCGKGKMMKQL